jgi:hypothetical protein
MVNGSEHIYIRPDHTAFTYLKTHILHINTNDCELPARKKERAIIKGTAVYTGHQQTVLQEGEDVTSLWIFAIWQDKPSFKKYFSIDKI